MQFLVIASTLCWSLKPYTCVHRNGHTIYKPSLSCTATQWLIMLLLCSTQPHINAELCTTEWMTSNMARWVTIGPHSAALGCIAVICKIKIDSIVRNYGPSISYWTMYFMLHHWNLEIYCKIKESKWICSAITLRP